MDSLELAFYTAILPHLVSCERRHTGAAVLERMFPRFYAGSCSDPGHFYLVLENLCARGLRLADCDQGLDRDQAATMIRQVITLTMPMFLGGTSLSILLFSKHRQTSLTCFQLAQFHASSIAECHHRRRSSPGWSWAGQFPLSRFVTSLDTDPAIRAILPSTLTLLHNTFEDFRGSKAEEFLLQQQVD